MTNIKKKIFKSKSKGKKGVSDSEIDDDFYEQEQNLMKEEMF